jgi:Coenzyme PQQ synthesis protein D (PqqD)
MTDLDAALRPHPDVIAKRLDQTAVLVHMGTNHIFELNETGAKVWELLAEGVSTEGIVHQLVEQFEVEEEQAADEVKRLITQLRNNQLIAS